MFQLVWGSEGGWEVLPVAHPELRMLSGRSSRISTNSSAWMLWTSLLGMGKKLVASLNGGVGSEGGAPVPGTIRDHVVRRGPSAVA